MKELFTRNIGTKLLALLMAFALWFFVGMQNPELTMNYKDIRVSASQAGSSTNGEGLSVIGLQNQRVEVVAKGRRSLLTSFSANEIRAWVDTSGISEPGSYNLPVHVTMPVSDLLIDRITPATVNVRLDYIEQKEVPVSVSTETVFDDGSHVIEEVSFSPKTVTVTGPATELSEVAEARVHLTVDTDGIEGGSAPFTLVNAAGEEVDTTYLTTDVEEIGVHVPVLARKEVPLTVALVNNTAGWDEGLLSYTVTPSKITLLGERSALDAISELQIGQIDLATFTEGQIYTFDITLPEGVTTTLPELKATVSVTVGDLVTETVTVSNFEVQNLPEGAEALVMTPSVEVRLRGKSEELAALQADRITGVVDFQNSEVAYGTYEMPVTFTLPGGSGGILVSGEYTVSVRLVRRQNP